MIRLQEKVNTVLEMKENEKKSSTNNSTDSDKSKR